MATRTDTLPHFLTDVAEAIRTKGGTSATIQASKFDEAIADLPSGDSGYSGHYDTTGLTQLGWSADDINYYQEHGVLWNSDKDNDYKLLSTEIAGTAGTNTRFGKTTDTSANFIYYYSLLAVPTIDTSSQTNWSAKFQNCYNLITIPLWNSQSATDMNNMFNSCYNLREIPLLDTSSVTDMNNMFNSCHSLETIPLLNTENVTNMSNMFNYCISLREIPQIDTSSVTNMKNMFYNCYALTSVPYLDTTSTTTMSSMFYNCNNLSDESLNNIMLMCVNATNYTTTWKRFSTIGLSSSIYATRAQQLSNYQAFINAGWTTQ